MLAWPKPSDFDAMLKTGVRRSGRIAVVSDMFPLSSHHTIAVRRKADGACVRRAFRLSETWPPPCLQPRPPTLEHVRTLWTLHGIQSNCTAAIWRNDFSLELRVEHGGELIESRLSRLGEAPLLLIADQLKANLIAQGWFEVPQATDAG
jgi:hypothetical protein